MDTLEEEREKALDYLTDCYARSIFDLRQYEDRRDKVVAADSVPAIREAIRTAEGGAAERDAAESGATERDAVRRPAAPAGTTLCIMGTRKVAPTTMTEPAQTICIMGDVMVDLRKTTFSGEVHISTLTIMGDTVIHVPENARVHNGITAIMADVKEKDAAVEEDGPVIHLTGLVLMGDVKIKRSGK